MVEKKKIDRSKISVQNITSQEQFSVINQAEKELDAAIYRPLVQVIAALGFETLIGSTKEIYEKLQTPQIGQIIGNHREKNIDFIENHPNLQRYNGRIQRKIDNFKSKYHIEKSLLSSAGSDLRKEAVAAVNSDINEEITQACVAGIAEFQKTSFGLRKKIAKIPDESTRNSQQEKFEDILIKKYALYTEKFGIKNEKDFFKIMMKAVINSAASEIKFSKNTKEEILEDVTKLRNSVISDINCLYLESFNGLNKDYKQEELVKDIEEFNKKFNEETQKYLEEKIKKVETKTNQNSITAIILANSQQSKFFIGDKITNLPQKADSLKFLFDNKYYSLPLKKEMPSVNITDENGTILTEEETKILLEKMQKSLNGQEQKQAELLDKTENKLNPSSSPKPFTSLQPNFQCIDPKTGEIQNKNENVPAAA